MTPAFAFATHFARLLSQRVREPDNLEAHRATLTDLLAANDDGITLTWDNWQLRIGGDVLAATAPGMLDLLTRMAAHGIRELSFTGGTDAAQLLGVVWILSQDPVIGDGGARAMARLTMLGAARSVRMVPVAAPAVVVPVHPTPVKSPPAVGALPDPQVPKLEERETAEVLIARFRAASAPDEIARALDALATFTELPRKRLTDVVAILQVLIGEEPRFTDPDAKRAFGFVLKRIAKPSMFRALAAAMSMVPDKHDEYMQIFTYFGDAAADEVIEQLAHAESSQERRVLFDALVELQRGVATLIYLLGDERWYVVRNAAELLGEMRAPEAEQGLAWLLSHGDPRVRRSATSALAKLETPGARAALKEAMKDASPEVRMGAALALANFKERTSLPQILRALADEQDTDVQRTMMVALAKIGTPEAIQHLVAAAEPERGLFKKKPTPLRVAAVAALAASDAPTAIAAIQALTKDKERDVREAASRALTPVKGATALPKDGREAW